MKFLTRLSLCIFAFALAALYSEAGSSVHAHILQPQTEIVGTVEAMDYAAVSDYYLPPALPSMASVPVKASQPRLPSLCVARVGATINGEGITTSDSRILDNPVIHIFSRQTAYYIFALRRIRI